MIDKTPKAKGDANRELARKIAAAIESSPLTAKKIGEECGVTAQAVNGWKVTGRISKEMLVKFAGVVGLPVNYFISDAPEAAVSPALPEIGELNGDKLMRLFILYGQSTKEGQDLILSTAELVAKRPLKS